MPNRRFVSRIIRVVLDNLLVLFGYALFFYALFSDVFFGTNFTSQFLLKLLGLVFYDPVFFIAVVSYSNFSTQIDVAISKLSYSLDLVYKHAFKVLLPLKYFNAYIEHRFTQEINANPDHSINQVISNKIIELGIILTLEAAAIILLTSSALIYFSPLSFASMGALIPLVILGTNFVKIEKWLKDEQIKSFAARFPSIEQISVPLFSFRVALANYFSPKIVRDIDLPRTPYLDMQRLYSIWKRASSDDGLLDEKTMAVRQLLTELDTDFQDPFAEAYGRNPCRIVVFTNAMNQKSDQIMGANETHDNFWGDISTGRREYVAAELNAYGLQDTTSFDVPRIPVISKTEYYKPRTQSDIDSGQTRVVADLKRYDLVVLLEYLARNNQKKEDKKRFVTPNTRAVINSLSEEFEFDQLGYALSRRMIYSGQKENILTWEQAVVTKDYTAVLRMLRAAPTIPNPDFGLVDSSPELKTAYEKYKASAVKQNAFNKALCCPIALLEIETPVNLRGVTYELLSLLAWLTSTTKSPASHESQMRDVSLDEINFDLNMKAMLESRLNSQVTNVLFLPSGAAINNNLQPYHSAQNDPNVLADDEIFIHRPRT